jgi:hypothetical protein
MLPGARQFLPSLSLSPGRACRAESVVKRKYRKKNNEGAVWHGFETEQRCLARRLLDVSPSKMLPTAKMAVGHLETRTIRHVAEQR